MQSPVVQSLTEEQVRGRPARGFVQHHPAAQPSLTLAPLWLLEGQPAPYLTAQTHNHLPLCSTAFVSKQEGSEVVKRPRRYVDQGLG